MRSIGGVNYLQASHLDLFQRSQLASSVELLALRPVLAAKRGIREDHDLFHARRALGRPLWVPCSDSHVANITWQVGLVRSEGLQLRAEPHAVQEPLSSLKARGSQSHFLASRLQNVT